MKSLTALLLTVLAACASAYVLKAVVLDGGGRSVMSPDYRCGFGVGQQAASGTLRSGNWSGYLGFWHTPYAPVGIEEGGSRGPMMPLSFSLSRSFPNPFSRSTTVRYSLGRETDVDLSVVDPCGRVVWTLVQGRQKPGTYKVSWDLGSTSSQRLPNGIYFCRLVAGEFQAVQKMVKLE